MAAVRDPAFWKRFSMAVHLDEEAATQPSTPTSAKHPDFARSESWLERQHKKKTRTRWTLCLSVLGFLCFVTLLVLVVVWLSKHGWFLHGEKVSFP
ncbi:hypothetical protein MMC13_004950 [Lambiella insularis]|nr:hypothetical protein [Lambiella insularis]